MDTLELQEKFKDIYNENAGATFFSPGRINLIGEHTDYNGGHVFPCAISLGTYAAARKRKDKKFRFFSENFPDLGIVECELSELKYKEDDRWVNYPKGVIKYIAENYELAIGADIYVYGNIPNGSGLSSSASLELLIAIIIDELFDLDISRLDMIKIGMRTENEFIGVNSGIMDQFAVGMGEKNKAIFLDTNTLEYELLPLDLRNNIVVIMNTNKRRELADSKYNERRGECEKAVEELQKELNINALGELDSDTFDEYTYLIHSENRIKRARHAVSENQRTIEAKMALENNDLERFGRLMNASHISLEYDYEVTGIELDTLVHTAWEQEGVLGARMTGAGFGGCAIALVDKNHVEDFKNNVRNKYIKEIGYEPDFYEAKVSSSGFATLIE